MDGSYTCFAARLNSGCIGNLTERQLPPGSLVVTHKHHFIRLWNDNEMRWRYIMIIDDFGWKYPPCLPLHSAAEEIREADTWTGSDLHKDRFDLAVIDKVLKDKCVQPLNYKMQQEGQSDGKWYWTAMGYVGLKRGGCWVQAKESKELWTSMLLGKKTKRSFQQLEEHEEEDLCDCCGKYQLSRCVLEEYPLFQACRKDVYEQVSERLQGNVDGEDFESLAPNHKRWSMYYWYSVNIFCNTAGRSELPKCFVAYVRSMYPDPVGEAYTGFVPKDA